MRCIKKTLESDKSGLHIENQQLYKENDKLTKHVYILEEQLASLKNETESTDEESSSSETTVVPQVPTSNSFLPLSDAKENTKEETNLKQNEKLMKLKKSILLLIHMIMEYLLKKCTEIQKN